jgi:hypothetical protein
MRAGMLKERGLFIGVDNNSQGNIRNSGEKGKI